MRRDATRRSRTPADAATQDLSLSRLRLLGVAVLCAKVALVPLVFDLSLDAPVSVPKAIVSHTLSYVLVGIIAGLFIQFGRRFFVWSWLHVPVVVFFAANILAALNAADPVVALYGTHVRMLGLGTIADWVVLYVAVVLLVRTRVDAAFVIGCGLGASVLVLLYEAAQLVGKDPFSWNFNGQVNPFSTLGQPTILGHYLTIVAVGSFAFGVLVDGLRLPVRVALLLYALLLLTGAGATGTRSAAVGIGTGSAVLIALIWVAHPTRHARAIALVAAATAALALTALLALGSAGSRLAATIDTLTADDTQGDLLSRLEPSAAARVALYAIAVQMTRERPLLGYGPDNFVVGVPKYRTASEPREIQSSLATSAHSWAGYVVTGSGLVGLGAFLAVIGVALGLAFRAGLRPVAMAAAAMLAAFLGSGLTTVSDIGTDWLFWANAAAIGAITAQTSSRSTRAASSDTNARDVKSGRRPTQAGWTLTRLVAILCVLVGVLASFSAVNAVDASRSARQSADSRLVGRVPRAIELALRATRSDPGRAEYWHGLGLAYIAASRWVDASTAFERASKLAPYDIRNIDDLAKAQLLLADSGDASARARAIDLADRAVQIDPNNPQGQLTRAVVMQFNRNLPEALRSIEKAIALDPASTSTQLWVLATQINLDSGRPADAAAVARHGVDLLGPTPSSILVRYELARALVALGRPRDALGVLDFALSIRSYAPAEQLRTTIRASLGN